MAKKHRRAPRRIGSARGRHDVEKQLAAAQELLAARQWDEAEKLLVRLEQRYPRNADVLRLQLALAAHVQDLAMHRRVTERLIRLEPGDGELVFLLAGSYLAALWIALALQQYRKFLERWPDHPDAPEARRTVATIEPLLEEELQKVGLTGPDGFDLAVLHEQIQVHLERGEFAAAISEAEQLLAKRPNFVAARNNLAEAHFRLGHYRDAVAQARRVLEIDPENVHALANLTRYLLLSGRTDEAAALGGPLRAAQPTNTDQWAKVAEALACLGDDVGVLQTVEAAQRTTEEGPPQSSALLAHLAGVAAARLGQEDEARAHWKRALRHQPAFELAQENLDDLSLPLGQRHGPWPFPMTSWLSSVVHEQLRGRLSKRKAKGTDEVRRFLHDHPEVEAVVPLLLDRGDPAARAWALAVAEVGDTPALRAALRDFALSQRGTDKERMAASQAAQRAGMLSGMVRMWIDGEWTDIELLGFELDDTPLHVLPPELEAIHLKAHEALTNRDGVTAERLLREALALAPDEPSLLNNMAMALELQGRRAQSRAMIREIHERFPDYWFGQVGVAKVFIEEGKLDEAEALLRPLRRATKLHPSEFAALMMAMIDLLLARGQVEGAKSFLAVWSELLPEHYALGMYKEKIRKRTGRWSWLPWRQRK